MLWRHLTKIVAIRLLLLDVVSQSLGAGLLQPGGRSGGPMVCHYFFLEIPQCDYFLLLEGIGVSLTSIILKLDHPWQSGTSASTIL